MSTGMVSQAWNVVIFGPPGTTFTQVGGVSTPAPAAGKYDGSGGVIVVVRALGPRVADGAVYTHGPFGANANLIRLSTPPSACCADVLPANDAGKLDRASITWSVKIPS